MLRYPTYENYKKELERCESGTSQNWGNVYETHDLLNYQFVVYGNHSTKQAFEAYTEYTESCC